MTAPIDPNTRMLNVGGKDFTFAVDNLRRDALRGTALERLGVLPSSKTEFLDADPDDFQNDVVPLIRYGVEPRWVEFEPDKTRDRCRLLMLQRLGIRSEQAPMVEDPEKNQRFPVYLPRGSGRVLKFLVHSDYTCADLQWIFLGAQVVKETNLRIFCAGRLLNDGNELGQYLARDGSIVSIERDCDTPLHFTQEVSVLFPDGKRRDIRAGPTVTFWQLALQLEGRTGEDAQSMSLYCGSNLLNPHLTLEQCGIGPDSTIRVAICQSNNT